MTATYAPALPIWCAGCGHYGVQSSLVRALNALRIPAHQVMVLAGIGCSGTVQNNLGTYGYHALHGRVLPSATGVHLADPDLTVVATGGDGDGYAIGMGHLVHAFRRNASFAYMVMNNAVYGLTKGQVSPTSEGGDSGPPLDAVALGLSIHGSTFIARGFARWSEHARPADRRGARARTQQAGVCLPRSAVALRPLQRHYAAWEASLVDVDADPAYDPADREGWLLPQNEQYSVFLASLVPTLLIHYLRPPFDLVCQIDPIRHKTGVLGRESKFRTKKDPTQY